MPFQASAWRPGVCGSSASVSTTRPETSSSSMRTRPAWATTYWTWSPVRIGFGPMVRALSTLLCSRFTGTDLRVEMAAKPDCGCPPMEPNPPPAYTVLPFTSSATTMSLAFGSQVVAIPAGRVDGADVVSRLPAERGEQAARVHAAHPPTVRACTGPLAPGPKRCGPRSLHRGRRWLLRPCPPMPLYAPPTYSVPRSPPGRALRCRWAQGSMGSRHRWPHRSRR
jgi:hypothetical protein